MYLKTPRAPSGPLLWSEFVLISPEDRDRIVGEVRPNISILKTCPLWLLKEGDFGTGYTLLSMPHLKAGHIPVPFKEAVICPLLKKANLDKKELIKFRPVSLVWTSKVTFYPCFHHVSFP